MLVISTQAKNQRGAALIVSLLILTVMTLIGVTAMSQSGLEALMAGNLQLQTSSMSEAENELAKAELALENIQNTAVAYVTYNKDITPEISPIKELMKKAESVSEFQDSYIEYLEPQAVPGESIIIGRGTPLDGSEFYLFRTTALHANSDSGSRRIVQSIFVTDEEPPPSLETN
ncbi:MAG: hypothetical protein COC05_03620 [Gammaproteobacteria bacterium]|nr:MAG: hypothetical protein COC05_03620 [Gammaproteobacteria bacterium]